MQAKCFMSLFLKENKLPTLLHLTVMEPNPEPDYPIYHHHDHHHSLSNMDTPVNTIPRPTTTDSSSSSTLSRYENQKRRDWNTFCQYLGSHRPPIPLAACTGMHVLDFLRYQDQFGKTKVHNQTCPFFGLPSPPAPCPCPLRQAWGSLDALLGRLRAAYEENGGDPGANPFGARGLRVYLKEVRDYQAKARGVSYEKKRKRPKEKKGPSP